MSRNRGFTLLELLVALAIFSLVMAMAYQGLRTVLNTRHHAEAQAERLAALQTTFAVLGRDIEQAVARPVRDELGDPRSAMLGTDEEPLALTRTGWRNPLGRPRSHLQRVAYALEDEALIRRSWQVLDRVQDSEPFEATLLSAVRAVEVRFLDGDQEWQTAWPPQGDRQAMLAQRPRAVEVVLDTADMGRVIRLFRVPG